MLSVLVLLLVVAAASFAYRAFWMLRARPSSRYVGSRFRDEVVAMSRRQRRRAFWGNVLLCVLCVAAMVLVGVLVGGMGGLYQPCIGGRRSARPGRPPQLQATGN